MGGQKIGRSESATDLGAKPSLKQRKTYLGKRSRAGLEGCDTRRGKRLTVRVGIWARASCLPLFLVIGSPQ